jgi:hypothetical protein
MVASGKEESRQFRFTMAWEPEDLFRKGGLKTLDQRFL